MGGGFAGPSRARVPYTWEPQAEMLSFFFFYFSKRRMRRGREFHVERSSNGDSRYWDVVSLTGAEEGDEPWVRTRRSDYQSGALR